ncbi:unnamed protein product [Prorocentrum cordatum]|uniref:Secreted protein n=1 Tax=Prorocentrum cordatum TaxID=2364126 RepID=A0ABN9S488_9DINO|nr:unnamed protein product [Polarella glacialis]
MVRLLPAVAMSLASATFQQWAKAWFTHRLLQERGIQFCSGAMARPWHAATTVLGSATFLRWTEVWFTCRLPQDGAIAFWSEAMASPWLVVTMSSVSATFLRIDRISPVSD